MPTHPYKQQLGVWINSKQDGDLTNTNSKKKYRIKSEQPDLRGNPLRGKTTDDGEANHYEMKQYKKVGANKNGEAPKSPTDFTFYWMDLVDLNLSSPLPNRMSLQRGRTQLTFESRVKEEAFKDSFSE